MRILLGITLVVAVISSACFRNVGHYTANDGSTIYVGEFYNDQPGPGYGPAEVKGYLYDASGNLIDTAGGFTCIGVDPHGVVPFKAWTFTDADKVAHIDWTIVDPPADPYLATGLQATVTNTFIADNQTYVVGEVTNNSTNVYVAAYVCASWTDSNGTVVREAWNNGGAWRFNPGDKVPFSIPVDTPPPGSAIHFYLDAGVTTGVPGEIGGSAVNIPSSALQHSFQKTTAKSGGYVTTGMGEVRNTVAPHFLPDAVAVVTDSSGKLLATRGDPSDCIVNAAPGGFTFMTYTVVAGVATPPKVTLQGFQYNNGPVYFPEVSGVQYHVDAATHEVTVTGSLKNTSSAMLGRVNACAGVYDASGVVRAVRMTSPVVPAGGLAPGATVPFTITMPDPGGVTSAKAVADGFKPGN